jgi:hypothetical protein
MISPTCRKRYALSVTTRLPFPSVRSYALQLFRLHAKTYSEVEDLLIGEPLKGLFPNTERSSIQRQTGNIARRFRSE